MAQPLNFPSHAMRFHGIGLALLIVGLAGCGTVDRVKSVKENPPNWLTPYRIDIGQGNYITESMAAQLKKGMTRDQVRAVLGTPLLVDPFRNDRWDYVFKLQRGDGRQDRRRFTVQFKDGVLESWEGDPLPKEGGEELLPSRPAR
ncbi:MAG: outer membrane protein assembly factor BamE [Burkholderiaceae bacterium]|nr:outer membrane protein assembly factor BamE [Burkholderiaceae bacterium]